MSTSPESRLSLRGRGRPLTWGEGALAALLAATVSGAVLALPYDIQQPFQSLATMLLANPAAAWFRNVHFWTAQAFLILTGVHAWGCLRRGSQGRVGRGAWTRLVVGIPATLALMLTGFLLRGDVDAAQALRVVAGLLQPVPALTRLLEGDGGLPAIYLAHAAGLTIFTWLIVVEHGRVLWPTPLALLATLGPASLISLWLSPSLHDGLERMVKGPWYFVGLQEALHGPSHPLVVMALGAWALLLVYALRWMREPAAGRARKVLLIAAMLYGVLTGVGLFFRGEDGALAAGQASGLVRGWVLGGVRAPMESRPVAVVLGRPEGCLTCHAGTTGLGRSHEPASIGCASCHRGNPFSLDGDVAHRGMERVPGNLDGAERTCGTSACHPGVVVRVKRSVMATLSGVVAVDRETWGEDPGAAPHVETLGHSVADGHLRQLCASCHLGAVKAEPGPVTEETRGGGCNACHLRYDPPALEALRRYRQTRAAPFAHPRLSVQVGDDSCFGCHSRSGRISLSYRGWYESDGPGQTSLQDGRSIRHATPDVHHARGMQCVDCHTAAEVMGDGVPHQRKREQLRVRCEDCHAARLSRTVTGAAADDETQRIRALRPGPAGPMVVAASGDALVNTVVGRGGRARLVRKADGRALRLDAPARACRDASHGRLSCVACHSAWAPRCATCHTGFAPERSGFDLLSGRPVSGQWVERSGRFSVGPPTLGVAGGVVDPFVPGMVATLDAGRGAPPLFRRLYARLSPHTVTRGGRSCRSCHADPVALGYGEGRLDYVARGRRGRWTFAPAFPASPADGLSADAWIGFLSTRTGMVSTRPDARPLTGEEQQRVLAVGACLTCHEEGSAVMRSALRGFAAVLRRASPRCSLPEW